MNNKRKYLDPCVRPMHACWTYIHDFHWSYPLTSDGLLFHFFLIVFSASLLPPPAPLLCSPRPCRASLRALYIGKPLLPPFLLCDLHDLHATRVRATTWLLASSSHFLPRFAASIGQQATSSCEVDGGPRLDLSLLLPHHSSPLSRPSSPFHSPRPHPHSTPSPAGVAFFVY